MRPVQEPPRPGPVSFKVFMSQSSVVPPSPSRATICWVKPTGSANGAVASPPSTVQTADAAKGSNWNAPVPTLRLGLGTSRSGRAGSSWHAVAMVATARMPTTRGNSRMGCIGASVTRKESAVYAPTIDGFGHGPVEPEHEVCNNCVAGEPLA